MSHVLRALLAVVVFVTAAWFAGVYLLAPLLPSGSTATSSDPWNDGRAAHAGPAPDSALRPDSAVTAAESDEDTTQPGTASPVATAEPAASSTPGSSSTRAGSPSQDTTSDQTATSDPTATALDPDLAAAFSRARAAAANRGVSLAIRSGHRSAAVQQRMYDAAVRRYGSAARAQRWVLPPEKSAHVQGDAIDVRPRSGAAWLERNGAQFGLCRRYDNEWWHFELRTTAGRPCPPREPHAGG